MISRVMVVWLALATTLAAQTPGSTEDKPVAIAGTKAVRFCADCTNRQHVFRVTLRTRTPPAVRPVVTEVVVNGAHDPTLDPHFAFAWRSETNAKTRVTSLVLTLADALQRPGEYDVTVNLMPNVVSNPVLDVIKVTISPSTIEPSEKLVVSRTVYSPEWLGGRSSAERQPLVLHETGRLSGVRSLQGLTHRMDSNDKPVSARIAVGALALGAGGSNENVPYTLEGTFPLGTSTGELRLTADELAAPLTVDVEVRSRLTRWYLLVTILVGLVVSWKVKVKLAEDIARAQAEAPANELLARIESDRLRYAEPEFATDIQQADQDLREALGRRVAATIEQKRIALDSVWREAVKAAVARRTAFTGELESLATLVNLPWPMPALLEPALADARRRVAALERADRKEIDVRSKELAKVRHDLLNVLETTGDTWQQDVSRAFGESVGPRHGLPAGMEAELSAAVAAWATEYPRVGLLPQTDPKRLEPELRTLAGQLLAARELARWIGHQLHRTLAEVALELPNTPTTLPNVAAAIGAIQQAASQAVDQPQAAAKALAAAISTLQHTWTTDILAALDPAVLAEARAEIEAHKYVSAAKRRPEEKLLGGGVIATVVSAVLDPLRFPQFSMAASASTVIGEPAPEMPSYAARAVKSVAELRRAKRLQSIIVFFLFLGWAVGSLGESWNGTWEGLLTVFFAAVAIDVATDKLLGKIG